ncbi:ABC transporter permease [Jhaorihella thermophila]|uniref:Transport permease protein n=1 Tax=Jhaorihella thermophila TaxID=488547 RepID=A0A1H5TGW3_9RHOB|nr:ABC transporter permease [Jhaorihella thermophila]SEF61438.1 ABC-2 type transport system permease protein [Jhaorihella thermophila]
MTSLRRIWAILRKELVQLRRDRTTAALILMIPQIQLILFGYAINTNVRHIPVAVVDQSRTGLSRALIQMVEATQVVDVTLRLPTVQEARRAVRASRVRAVLILPPDLDARVARSPAANMGQPDSTEFASARPVGQWIVDASDTMVAGAIKGLRLMPLAELFRQPPNRQVPTCEVALFSNPEQRTEVNVVPGLVGIILTMTMIMFTSAAIVRERERGNMEMLINTPVRPIELMLGKIVPYMGIGLVQMAIILSLGHVLFNVPVAGSLWVLLAITLLFILASLSLGLVFSTFAKSQLQAMQLTVFVLLPSILLSGFMFPYDGMPKPAQWIANVLPATHLMTMIRGVVLRDAWIEDLAGGMIWMGGFAALGLLVATLRFRKRLD